MIIFSDKRALFLATIVKESGGYSVYSESKGKNGKRKRLGGPYATKAAAVKRLQQIEYFKHNK